MNCPKCNIDFKTDETVYSNGYPCCPTCGEAVRKDNLEIDRVCRHIWMPNNDHDLAYPVETPEEIEIAKAALWSTRTKQTGIWRGNPYRGGAFRDPGREGIFTVN